MAEQRRDFPGGTPCERNHFPTVWRRLYGLHSTPDLVLVFRQLDRQRFLHLAQGHRSMRGLVAEWEGRPFNSGRILVDARSRET